jgi:predicted amidophosphoribosyltransferase
MRDRHLPRLCRACHAPMARQEDTCWRCGTQWATEDRPRTPLHVIPGGAPTDAVGRARALHETRLAMDRWVDEGGRVPFEAAAVPRATRARP